MIASDAKNTGDGASGPGPAVAEGPLDWAAEAPYFQAGLAGYSDAAMRLIARRHGSPYCITEAMLDQFLINGGKGLQAAELDEEDHPIAGQLMGSHPEDIAAGAKILVELGYDVVDINLACPVKKIKKKCRGGHLLSSPGEAIDILRAVRDAVGGREGGGVPLTVKLRRAYDESEVSEAAFYQIFEAAIDLGYSGATVHARTVEQKYLGPSRWPFLAELTQRYRDEMTRGFRIFGSGDIFTPESIFEMVKTTGVQAASVARGCIGNPWIFRQAQQLMRGEVATPPTLMEQREVLLEHFQLSVDLHGESQAGRMMRKFGIKFSVHHPDGDAVKNAFIRVKNLSDWRAALDAFYPQTDVQGVT
ncbi:MAG: tRNA-dihydrouridine synthase [Phycisphaeraceae bacterium]